MVRILIDSVWHEGISLEAWRKEAVRTKQTIRLHSVLLRRFLIGDNTEVSIIDCVAMYAMNVVLFKPFFGLFVQYLWDEKVIGDEALLLWKEQVEEEEVNVELLKDESIRKVIVVRRVIVRKVVVRKVVIVVRRVIPAVVKRVMRMVLVMMTVTIQTAILVLIIPTVRIHTILQTRNYLFPNKHSIF